LSGQGSLARRNDYFFKVETLKDNLIAVVFVVFSFETAKYVGTKDE